MKKLKIHQYWGFILSAFSWLAIDLTTKQYALSGQEGPVVLIKNFFYLSFQTNRGIAFGILLGHIIQVIASILILGFLVYFGFKYILNSKRNSFLNQFLLGIIVGGAFGNLINRIQLGYVIDFIVLKPFPVFNIADLGITIGLLALFLLTFQADTNH